MGLTLPCLIPQRKASEVAANGNGYHCNIRRDLPHYDREVMG